MGAEPVNQAVDDAAPTSRTGSAAGTAAALRPQSVMLTFLGNYVLGRDLAVFSGSFIDVFARLGVGEHAIRSTLTRMVGRGLLARHRRGRRMYFSLTERSTVILRDGEARIWQRGAVNTDWDGTWTVLAFSLPESWQRQRHDLRSRLVWAGFGALGNGMWIAPSGVDAGPLVNSPELEGRVKVFTGVAQPPTDLGRMVRDAFDLDRLMAGYSGFLLRWDVPHPCPDAPDDLARYLRLLTEWLQLVRVDPRLPVEHLPPDWPAARAQHVVRRLRSRYEGPAREIADRICEIVELG